MAIKILGIETSCDETAAGVVEDGRNLLSNVISSQADLHSVYGGVVPEIASRQHVRDLVPVLEQAASNSGLGLEDMDAIAVTFGPGLAGSLITGVNAAKAIAYSLGIPLIGVNHLEGHIYASWLGRGDPKDDPGFPLACLVASGGHTDLLLMEGHGRYKLVGRTRDDAAGEAFDKAARILGLGFPGGPEIQRVSDGATGEEKLPRAWMRGTLDFSFSGVKTALLHLAQARGIYPPEKSVLGEDVTAEELGGPRFHALSGTVDLVTNDELGSLRTALRLLAYLPDNNRETGPFHSTSDPVDRHTEDEHRLFARTFNSPAGMNAPMDITLYLQQICDHGEFFQLQPQRARNMVTAFGRLGGWVTGFVANNSAVGSGQIDIDAALKATRFIRFCNLYNIPLIFVEDTTGFLPGTEQEHRGIIQAGRKLLDAIIDVRTPRMTMIIRNAFGGAYAAYNSHFVGSDLVFAMPMARVAVMGSAGMDFVYKDEMRAIAAAHKKALKGGGSDDEANGERDRKLADLTARYESELMNPKEALSLGSVSRLVMPGESRKVLARNLDFLMRKYQPTPMGGVQREHE